MGVEWEIPIFYDRGLFCVVLLDVLLCKLPNGMFFYRSCNNILSKPFSAVFVWTESIISRSSIWDKFTTLRTGCMSFPLDLDLKDQGHHGVQRQQYTIGWSYGSWPYAASSLLLYGKSFGILNKLWSFQVLDSTLNHYFLYLSFSFWIVYHFLKAWFTIPIFFANFYTEMNVGASTTDFFFSF